MNNGKPIIEEAVAVKVKARSHAARPSSAVMAKPRAQRTRGSKSKVAGKKIAVIKHAKFSENNWTMPWKRDHCLNCSEQVLVWTIWSNVFLTVVKLWGGVWSGSAGLIADGMESISCLMGSSLIMLSLKIARKKANKKYPFGYGKIEFLVTLLVFSIILGLGLYIAIPSFLALIQGKSAAPDLIGIPFAALAVFVPYMMYRYNNCAGDKLDGSGLKANAFQTKADCFSSLAVLVGLLLAQLGPVFAAADNVAALFVGILIVKDALENWIENIKVVLDSAPEPHYKQTVARAIGDVFPDHEPRTLKLNRIGQKYWLGIGLDFAGVQTLGELLKITKGIEKKLFAKCDWIQQVEFFVEDWQKINPTTESVSAPVGSDSAPAVKPEVSLPQAGGLPTASAGPETSSFGPVLPSQRMGAGAAGAVP